MAPIWLLEPPPLPELPLPPPPPALLVLVDDEVVEEADEALVDDEVVLVGTEAVELNTPKQSELLLLPTGVIDDDVPKFPFESSGTNRTFVAG